MIPTYLPAVRYGGPMFAVHALCRHLASLGHEVHVFTTTIDGETDLEVPAGQPVDRDDVKIWYFKADRMRRLAMSSEMKMQLRDQLPSFDVLHTHSVFLWPPWQAARRARSLNVPYVMAPRGMLVPELIARRSRIAKTAWLTLLERRNLACADALHFTSELEREDARRLGISARRSEVIPNGIDLSEVPAPQRTSSAEPFVLFIGRINWKKGLDALLRALVDAKSVRAVIAGNDEGGHRRLLEKLAEQCGVSSRVEFLDAVYGEEKWALLRAARAFVLPSHSENFGNAVLEAMAAGIPVIVTPAVGLAAAVQNAECGVVVDNDPLQLAKALIRLWTDEGLRESMGRRGRATVERDFAWPRIAAQTVDLYQSILDARRG